MRLFDTSILSTGSVLALGNTRERHRTL